MKILTKIGVLMLAMIVMKSCSSDDNPQPDPTPVTSKEDVVKNYVNMVYQNYKDSYDATLALQTAVLSFTDAPSEAGFNQMKTLWLQAREFYGQTEVFRGSDGPVDNEGSEAWTIGNEGQMNAWPLNEAYIDYVALKTSYTGTYDVSILSGTEVITKELIANLNEANDDEKAVSTGWHAIEFLIWGQDNTNPADKLAGLRTYTDYTTAENAERRKDYLEVATALLIDDLKDLVDTWATGGEYYNVFMAMDTNEALTKALKGPTFLASFELSNERLLGPAVSSDGIDESGQEDEHSCFSDNTHRDVYTNALGIINVLKGKYGNIEGPSPLDLITEADAAQGAKLLAEINKMEDAIDAIDAKAKSGTPFDLMILEEGENNPGIVLAADQALKDLADVIIESAQVIGVILTRTTS